MTEVDQRNDSDVLRSLEYLAWCLRSSQFEGDFKNKICEWYNANIADHPEDGAYAAKVLWGSMKKFGIVETYQTYQNDRNMMQAFAFAINVGPNLTTEPSSNIDEATSSPPLRP